MLVEANFRSVNQRNYLLLQEAMAQKLAFILRFTNNHSAYQHPYYGENQQ